MAREIRIETSFAEILPDFTVAVLEADITNKLVDMSLQRELNRTIGIVALSGGVDKIKDLETIASTREAYKRLGKDPNRYRPAAEQLRRRILKGLGLYTINQLVDIGNLVSLETGFSIGVFDADKVGQHILLRQGKAEDDFEGIGRGPLNVENLPLYVDENAPFATPTSDAEHTKVTLSTKRTLVFINSYLPKKEENMILLSEALDMLKELLVKHVEARNIEQWFVTS